jgi:hypothetical protein
VPNGVLNRELNRAAGKRGVSTAGGVSSANLGDDINVSSFGDGRFNSSYTIMSFCPQMKY